MSAHPQVAAFTLIGQYDSPFVRRVAVTLRHYRLDYEHWPWSVWADAERLAQYNPLRRVPVLLLQDRTVLVESAAILDYLDGQVPDNVVLLPRAGAARREGLRACALASGLADKAVALLYERVLRVTSMQNVAWAQRCRAQISDTAATLEAELGAKGTPFWLGSQLSHADVALTCVLRFAHEAHADWLPGLALPRLRALAARCEALPQFQAVVQPLHVQLEPQ